MNNEIPDLNTIRDEKDALDQSIALNRIVMSLLNGQKEANKRLFIALVISLLVNAFTVAGFLWYESQWEYATTTETVTIEQDTGEGTGNNVYQAGENASYTQSEGGVG